MITPFIAQRHIQNCCFVHYWLQLQSVICIELYLSFFAARRVFILGQQKQALIDLLFCFGLIFLGYRLSHFSAIACLWVPQLCVSWGRVGPWVMERNLNSHSPLLSPRPRPCLTGCPSPSVCHQRPAGKLFQKPQPTYRLLTRIIHAFSWQWPGSMFSWPINLNCHNVSFRLLTFHIL